MIVHVVMMVEANYILRLVGVYASHNDAAQRAEKVKGAKTVIETWDVQ